MENHYPLWVYLSISALFLLSVFFLYKGIKLSKTKSEPQESLTETIKAKETARPIEEVKKEEKILPPTPKGLTWKERLEKGLGRSRQEVWGKALSFFGAGEVTGAQWDEIEEILYSADIGPALTQELLDYMKKNFRTLQNPEEIKNNLRQYLQQKMVPVQEKLDNTLVHFNPQNEKKLKVIMIVGVNGVGKTTTIGKLATKLTQQGANVVVGACDTFRAAAVDQLQVWCDRAGATMIRAKENSAPSGVGYTALAQAIESGADYCLLDTAGRLHNNESLMEELKKSKNVLKKLLPEAPHSVLLVLDAITGQNALRQAQEFHKALDLTGLIITKCDGSSKAGSAIGIQQSLSLPVTYIGVGESVEDLELFSTNDYLSALLG